MKRSARLALVEERLLTSCLEARSRGVAIVFNAFSVPGGVCALGAADLCQRKVGLRRAHIEEEWNSIEHGFDGIDLRRAESCMRADGFALDRDFYWIGRRLRAEVQPVDAATLARPSCSERAP